jgi:tetratricopeptide (TPR) repeat protein
MCVLCAAEPLENAVLVDRVCAAALILSTSVPLTAWADRRTDVRVQILVEEADASVVDGRFGDALAGLDEAVALEPASFGLWYRLAALRSAVGDAPGVVEALTMCMSLDPRRTDLAPALEAARAASSASSTLDRAGFDSDPAIRSVAADEAAAMHSWLLTARALETLEPAVAPLARAGLARAWGDAAEAVEQLRNAHSSDAVGDAALDLAAMLAVDGDVGAATFFVLQAADSGADPERLAQLADRLGVALGDQEEP